MNLFPSGLMYILVMLQAIDPKELDALKRRKLIAPQ